MRALIAVLCLVGVACTVPPTAPNAPAGPSNSTTDTSHTKAPPSVHLVGTLVNGGNWVPGVGDAVPVGVPYDVSQRFYFVARDSAGDSLGAVSPARIDSVAYYNAGIGPPGQLEARDPTKDCPIPAGLVLTCPASAGATFVGQYVVTVSPGTYTGTGTVTNADAPGSFELYVFPP